MYVAVSKLVIEITSCYCTSSCRRERADEHAPVMRLIVIRYLCPINAISNSFRTFMAFL